MEKLPSDLLPTDPLQLEVNVFSDEYLDALQGQTLGNKALNAAVRDEKAAALRVFLSDDPTDPDVLGHWQHKRNIVSALEVQSRTQQSPPSER